MRFAEDSQSPFSVQSVSEDGVVIDDRHINRSVLVSNTALQDWAPNGVDSLTAADADHLRSLAPEIVILGTGRRQAFPPAAFVAGLQQHGIGVEVMANNAACRTFNVLLSEDRHVLLALIQD